MPEPDKSIGRKILSFFVKEEEPGVATGTKPTTGPTPPRPAAEPSGPTPAPSIPVPSSGAIDAKFAEHFATVLAQNNPPGPDYFEFRETVSGRLGKFQGTWWRQ